MLLKSTFQPLSISCLTPADTETSIICEVILGVNPFGYRLGTDLLSPSSKLSLEKAKAVLSEFTLVQKKTSFDTIEVGYENYTKFINEFWTAKQRQANSIHEISYRACYKPQLPNIFIDIFTLIALRAVDVVSKLHRVLCLEPPETVAIDDAHAPVGDEINVPGFVQLIENLFAGRKAPPPARHFEIPALLVRQVDEGADIRQIVLLRYRHNQPLLREPRGHVIAPRTENRAFDPCP